MTAGKLSEITAPQAIKASASGRHLVRAATGQPFFWKGDTAWELCHRLTDDEVLYYLDARQSQGFNIIMTVVLTELDQPGTPNMRGDCIFLPDEKGSMNNPTRPNEAYFRHIDWVVDEAHKRGITIALVPTWGRYINGGWLGGGPIVFDERNAEIYGEYIGKRYPGLPKILGGDTNRFWMDTSEVWKAFMDGKVKNIDGLPKTDSGPVVRAMARGLKKAEAAAGVDAFLTYHPTAMWLQDYPEARAAAYFDEDWLSMDAVQSGHADFRTVTTEPLLKWWVTTQPYTAVKIMWDDATLSDGRGKRPTLDLEGHYEGMRNGLLGNDPRIFGAADIRNGAYHTVFSGTSGYTYGCNSCWQAYQPERGLTPTCGLDAAASWREDAVQLQGASQLRHLFALLEGLAPDAFDRRAPAQDLLLEGCSEGEERVSICRDVYESKPSTFVYAYSGMGKPFKLDLAKAFADAAPTGAWVSPRDGTKTGFTFEGNDFTPPSSGDIENDWVLVLTL